MVSVIVPAYNAERWLEAAVASVTAQTVRDWELVLVDDGSTDGTPALCDRLAAGDRRIRVFHTPNGGLSVARNNGIDVATGDWITFLDADDLLHPQFMEIMLNAAEQTNADIVNCGLVKFSGEQNPFSGVNEDIKTSIYEPVQAMKLAMYQSNGVQTSSSGKVYKKKLWDTERFTPGTWYEDLDVFYRVWSNCERFVQLNAAMYGYRQHSESFLHKYTPRRQDVLCVTERMETWVQDNCPELLPAARDRRMSSNFNMFLLSEQAVRQGQAVRADVSDLQRQCFDVIRERRMQSLFGRYTRSKNRIGALISYLGPSVLRLLGGIGK